MAMQAVTFRSFDRPSRRQAIVLGGAALATGCVRHRDAGLALWAMGIQGEYAPRLMPNFTAAGGGQVDVQTLPWTGAHSKLLTAYAGRSLPDVVMVPVAWLAELVMLGAVLPVADTSLTVDLFEGAARGAAIGGRAYGVPWYVDSWAQYYRPDILRAGGYAMPPADWQQWRQMAFAVKRRAPERYVVLSLLDWPEQLFAHAAQIDEPPLRDHDTRGNFTSSGFREVLRFYKALFDDGFAPPVVGSQMGDTLIAFRDGYFAILPSDAKTVNDLRVAKVDRKLWRTAPLPGPHGPAPGLSTGSMLCVTRDAANPARAWGLVRYLCSPATQLAFYGLTNNLPSRRGAWSSPTLRNDPVSRVFETQLVDSKAGPAIPEWPRILTEVQAIAERMVRGTLSVEAAATAMNERVDTLLAKRRWLLERGQTA